MEHLLDGDYFSGGKYDESNPLILPAKKTKAVKKEAVCPPLKVLSRNQRRHLQKQVAKKQKKLTRSELWKELEGLTAHDALTPTVGKVLSRNRKTEKKLERLARPSIVKPKKWCDSALPSSDNLDIDDFSSSDEINSSLVNETSLHGLVESRGVDSDVSPAINKLNEVGSIKEQPVDPLPLKQNMKSKYVLVKRSPEIETARFALPIVPEEARIMEKISENDVVIICGATGCGKTTQVPQFLYEAGYTSHGYKICITEPRRVAAISMSERVSEELGLTNGEVGYHIRYEKNVSANTQIAFMTDGVLLQELKKDFHLSSYSAILIDEAHERSVYTDVLVGLLSLVTRLRRRAYDENPSSGRLPLKLIIMSATLRVEDFVDNRVLFPTVKTEPRETAEHANPSDDPNDEGDEMPRPGAPPVLKVDSRQFPVTCHFSRYTPGDYLKAAFNKVVSIHKESAPGGILVFLTGYREVQTLCGWLRKAFPTTKSEGITSTSKTYKSEGISLERGVSHGGRLSKRKRARTEDGGKQDECKKTKTIVNLHEPEGEMCTAEVPPASFCLDNFNIIPVDEEAELGLGNEDSRLPKLYKDGVMDGIKSAEVQHVEVESDGDSDKESVDADILQKLRYFNGSSPATPICALPLYSLLPVEQQRRVFEPPPSGHRLVVVATNVAETSLTIPNIRYVVDTGKVKSKIYDTGTGASSFRIVWISQASAEQRAGRAGRIGPGHCYRLYSSHIFTDEMAPFAAPDILTRPIDEVVLLLKSYLGCTPLSRFPLPTSPSAAAVEAAERRLMALGALEEKNVANEVLRTITPAGRWMAHLPLPARFARMLLFANQHDLMPYAVILVSALSVPEFFLPDPQLLLPCTDGVEAAGRQMKKRCTEAERLAQIRTNFLRQFVKTEEDLMLGDLAVLLGTVCCFDRYWAQLVGVVPPDGETGFPSHIDRVARLHPEATMRKLVQRSGIRWKAYIEIRKLRRQLTDILNANVPDLNLQINPALPKPSTVQVEQLRQLFLVGSVCHLATRYDLPVEGLPAKDRRRLKYAYKVPGVSCPVFIEATSPIARENYSFVAFTELHTTVKPYLRNICAINPAWVPFLAPNSYRVEGINVSENGVSNVDVKEAEDGEECPRPITTSDTAVGGHCPAPFYDAKHDTVLTYAKRVIFVGANFVDAEVASPHLEYGFELPASRTPFPLIAGPAAASLGDRECLVWAVRWFARSLLEGKVYPHKLSAWFPKQLKTSTPPRMITVSWGLVRPEVRGLISKMLSKKVYSRDKLEACLAENTEFLSRELIAWLSPSCHAEFLSKWPLQIRNYETTRRNV